MRIRKLTQLLLIIPFVFGASASKCDDGIGLPTESIIELEAKPIEEIEVVDVIELTPTEKFLEAIIYVESKGNDSAIGDRHLGKNYAVGVLQIRPIMVREVNRILRLKKDKHRFKLKDRYDREKSIQMFLIWKEFHHKDSDYEEIARSWNGGPKGMKNPRTYSYWKKVERQLKQLN
jgi:hypothetical protein